MRAILRYFAVMLVVTYAAAKEPPPQVIVWPTTGTPLVRFSFGKFKELSAVGNMHNYMIDTKAENLSSKPISSAVFNLYLYDKAKVRVGEGWMSLTDVAPGQAVKFETSIHTSGEPVSYTVEPRSVPDAMMQGVGPARPPKTVTITVNSSPQGAALKVDGQDAGTTPKSVELTVGKHDLQFAKEGFNAGHFPVDIGPNDASGGSISYELGTSAHDTIEMRDGSVLTGDVESLSATEVSIRISGGIQHFDRNQVKRILLIERDAPAQ